MCVAVPGRVLSIEGRSARVDFGGVERELAMDLVPGAGVGDWVLAHAGFAIQQLDEGEAQETLALFAEMEAMGVDPDAAEEGADGTR